MKRQRFSARAVAALNDALERIHLLPGTKTYLIEAGPVRGGRTWRAAHLPDQRVFIGSAFKTFTFAKFMKDVEAGQLSLNTPITIDDHVRMTDSGVFLELTGRVPARSALEAMISHSDNTAADACMAQVGADRVRDFVRSVGLTSTVIPDSVRIFASYLAGAPKGVDVGWEGAKAIQEGRLFGSARRAFNDEMSSISTAEELISYYRRSLLGEFFDKPSTLVDFKRIHAQGNLTRVAPPNTIAYAKAGSVNWQDFHALCGPGQLILCSGVSVTFAFTINWDGPDGDEPVVTGKFLTAVADVLAAVKQLFGFDGGAWKDWLPGQVSNLGHPD